MEAVNELIYFALKKEIKKLGKKIDRLESKRLIFPSVSSIEYIQLSIEHLEKELNECRKFLSDHSIRADLYEISYTAPSGVSSFHIGYGLYDFFSIDPKKARHMKAEIDKQIPDHRR